MRTRRISACCGLWRNQSSRSQLRAACHRPAPGLGSSGSMRGHRQSPDAARAFFSSCVRLGPGGCSKGAARGMPGGTQVRNTGRGSGRARSRADLGETAPGLRSVAAARGHLCDHWQRKGALRRAGPLAMWAGNVPMDPGGPARHLEGDLGPEEGLTAPAWPRGALLTRLAGLVTMYAARATAPWHSRRGPDHSMTLAQYRHEY